MTRSISDYRCPCCGLINISDKLIELDSKVIELIKFVPTISSACRCLKHNEKVGGGRNSSHLCEDPRDLGGKAKRCEAIDYATESSWRRARILDALVQLGIGRKGIGRDFIHWDIDPKKSSPVCWVY